MQREHIAEVENIPVSCGDLCAVSVSICVWRQSARGRLECRRGLCVSVISVWAVFVRAHGASALNKVTESKPRPAKGKRSGGAALLLRCSVLYAPRASPVVQGRLTLELCLIVNPDRSSYLRCVYHLPVYLKESALARCQSLRCQRSQ